MICTCYKKEEEKVEKCHPENWPEIGTTENEITEAQQPLKKSFSLPFFPHSLNEKL